MGALSREEDVKHKLRFIENMTQKADEVQNSVLAQILVQNSQTEYLLGLGLNGATDKETFKSKIPMVTYEDLHPLIQRIVDGDGSPILCSQPIHELVFSSGTSRGEIKLFPSIKEEPERRLFMHSICMRLMDRFVKGLDKGKGLYFMFSKSEIETPSGLMARSTLTSVYKSARFKERIPYLRNAVTSPSEAISCEDTSQSMYTQLLCGLYEREHVFWVGMVFASGLIRAIKFLQQNWQQLSRDIRTGSLNPEVTDPSIRKYMARILRPNPQLADVIDEECGKDDWEGIITRLWPNTKYLDVIVTGAMTQYIPTLDYYSGGLPIVCLMYASSECFFGINLDPLCKPSEVSYTIMPNMAYFEFLPYDPYSPRQPTHSDLVDLAKVEIGKEYEIVVTTISGLYRYQVGDILRATGFHNSSPQFRFVKRKNMVLNIDTEKTDETELQAAVDNASRLVREVNASLVDYTSYADTTTDPGHYVIYWELSKNVGSSFARVDDEVLAQCCLAMEESFNSVYRRYRVKEELIGPLEIRVVRNGTFEELMDHAISRGSSISQYKVPRCVSSKSMMDLLESRVVSRHFSPLLPHWIPEYSKEKMTNM